MSSGQPLGMPLHKLYPPLIYIRFSPHCFLEHMAMTLHNLLQGQGLVHTLSWKDSKEGPENAPTWTAYVIGRPPRLLYGHIPYFVSVWDTIRAWRRTN